ncbi:MAG: MaoC family dehydratase [Dehalococcoidia bacterium]|jgi:acyl dehydratase|nr:MaoC family dehydratase [Dehalococcoidia bacterium]MDP6228746.1 MaoC family dehydratase [Dehalococcoidia bacterium]MDP7084058.1 MaoC family dehydratase [Dehalococcoidia bacterium]MDP7200795.1 MaoC family dehydratase [Dehalococcoidia bacterium]MDP7511147.1 MaoC family dehydratase [Dehalococcoidia bacterium]
MATGKIEVNQEIPSVTKSITQEKINLFEACGILDRENIHNSPEMAMQKLGTTFPIASGRMSVAFASESLRKFFGAEVFNHSGTLNLKFLRPVKEGDTITVHGTVSRQEKVEKGTIVTVDVFCENQNQDKTAVGAATAIVP